MEKKKHAYVCRTYARIKHILTWHVPLVSSIGGGSETKKEEECVHNSILQKYIVMCGSA